MVFIARVLSAVTGVLLRRRKNSLHLDLLHIYGQYLQAERSQIPPNVVACLLAAEDHRFDRHGGADHIAILRGIWHLAAHRRLVGGSTLEQQLVRTVTRDRQKTIRRKIREILLATTVSMVVPKADIPGLYLSVAYFGWRMNGIRQACQKMGFALEHLTLRQSAQVVARLKYPEPSFAFPARALQIRNRARYIIRIVKTGVIPLPSRRAELQKHAALLDF